MSATTKRALDVCLAALLLSVTAPLLVVVALLVKVESPGPVFYRARRVGRHGRHFQMLKFRKMRADATGAPLTMVADARFTRIGSWLVRTHIDELPQLWNVVRGEMSLVGPRPEDPAFVAARRGDFDRILDARPGVTGWTQLLFADEACMLSGGDPVDVYVTHVLPCKVAWDLSYVTYGRLRDDLKILLWTALVTTRRWTVAADERGALIRLTRRTSAPGQSLAAGEKLPMPAIAAFTRVP